MRTLWLASAAALATLLSAAPAQAQSWSGSGVSVHRGTQMDSSRLGRDWDRDRRHHRPDRRNRGDRVSETVVLGPWGWDSDRPSDRAWEPNSYNDWWHDRPDRSFPRWVQQNAGCERRWWSGGAWRC